MFDELYLSDPLVSCFDGDAGDAEKAAAAAVTAAAAAAAAADATADAADAAAAGDDGGKTFNQVAVNKIVEERLARDRKSREIEHKQQYAELETRVTSLLENEGIVGEERDKLNTQLEDVRKQLRTKDQQAAHEKGLLQKDFDGQLKTKTEAAVMWEDRFRESSINRSLQDAAASNDAYNASQVVALLRPMTKLVEVMDEVTNKPTGDYKTMVDFPDQDEKGDDVITQGTPDVIVKRLKVLNDYANLFKSNVVAGVGANSATGGLTPGAGGRVDVSKLTTAQYAKLRKEDPASVGL